MQCNDGIRSRPVQTAIVILGSSSRANEPIPTQLSTAESQGPQRRAKGRHQHNALAKFNSVAYFSQAVTYHVSLARLDSTSSRPRVGARYSLHAWHEASNKR